MSYNKELDPCIELTDSLHGHMFSTEIHHFVVSYGSQIHFLENTDVNHYTLITKIDTFREIDSLLVLPSYEFAFLYSLFMYIFLSQSFLFNISLVFIEIFLTVYLY